MTAPDVHALLTRLAKDIGAVAALVRERGYGTERDKPAMLARLDGWQQTVQAALAHAPATPADKTCATCKHQIKSERNCRIVMFPLGVEVSRMEYSGHVIVRPGDPRFHCAFHEPASSRRATAGEGER